MNWLSAQVVAERLSISIRSVRSYIKSGKLPSSRLGRLRRVSEADLAEFMEKRRHRDELETIFHKQQNDLVRDAAEAVADWRSRRINEEVQFPLVRLK